MRFVAAPDVPDGLSHRVVSTGGTIEVGFYGDQVRAGFIGSPAPEIEWCCGGNGQQQLNHWVALCMLLRRREETVEAFVGIPRSSETAPCWRDETFLQRITELSITPAEAV